jgi:hypothetical protein
MNQVAHVRSLTDRLVKLVERETGHLLGPTQPWYDVLDSMELVEFVMTVEEEYGVEIPDETAEGFANVADMARYLAQAGVR